MKRSSHCLLATVALFAVYVGVAPLAGADGIPAPPPADSRLPAPPAGKGQVVFFRPYGPGWAISVHEGDRGVAKLSANQYSIYVTDPGPHTFTARYKDILTPQESIGRLQMEVDAGETYYVLESQSYLRGAVMVTRLGLTWSDAANFTMMKGMKLTDSKPADLMPAADSKSGAN